MTLTMLLVCVCVCVCVVGESWMKSFVEDLLWFQFCDRDRLPSLVVRLRSRALMVWHSCSIPLVRLATGDGSFTFGWSGTRPIGIPPSSAPGPRASWLLGTDR